MLLFTFALRHLRRHWRLNLAVLIGLTLAAALLAGLPSYATAIAARGLKQSLADTPPSGRNILVTASPDILGAGLYGRIKDALGDLVKTRAQVRKVSLPLDALPVGAIDRDGGVNTHALWSLATTDDQGRLVPHWLQLWSFDQLPSVIRVIDGKLPDPADPREATNPLKPPPLEVVLGSEAAARSGWGIGDRLRADYGLFGLDLDIVGIVEPLAPQDDVWWGDLSAFAIGIDAGDPNIDVVTLPLLTASRSMQDFIAEHQVTWRLLVDQDSITIDNAAWLQSALVNLQANLGKNRAQLSTRLIQLLTDYRTQLSRVRMSLFLLTAQAFIFVLYTLAMISSFLVDRSQGELSTLGGRGATALQITLIFALESLILALPVAAFLGPLTAWAAIAAWVEVTGTSIPVGISGEAHLLALIAAGFGWLAVVLPVYPAARRSVLQWQWARARPARLSTSQRLYLDLFLLALGGLLYWQLNQSGSFLMRRLQDTPLADPLLLLGPSLLLVAVAMVFLRFAPLLLQLIAWLFQRARGLLLPLGLARLARDPLKPSRVVLLISLTAGLTLFTNAFGDSLTHSQAEMAHYLAGADLRLSLNQPTDLPLYPITNLPGVLTASPVFRAMVQTDEGRAIQLFAVDPATYAQVARYPPGLTNLTIASIVAGVRTGVSGDELSAIFSYTALPSGKTVGDQLRLTLAGRRLPVVVQGTINNFPTLSGAFVILSLPELEKQIDPYAIGGSVFESHEAWLRVDPAQHATLVRHPQLKDRILDDAQVQFRRLQADTLTQGTNRAFQLNTLTLALLSVAGFLLVHFFAAQQRVVEFSVLRAIGLSARQLLTLLVTEGALVMGLGLAAGAVIGYGLAHVMVPYLSRALTQALAGVIIGKILIDWPAVARLYTLLAGCYGLAMLLLLLALMRVGIHRALRIGDE